HPDIGFAILPEYERKGYTTEAGHAMVELAKEQYKLTSLLGITIPDNTASQKVLEKLGLQLLEEKVKDGERLLVYGVDFL
ncbi:MAG: GNAT family N-acetyltransferase, partial [Bacteroidia bacterium]